MSRTSRKLDHLNLAITGRNTEQGFQNVQFVHQALPEVAYTNTSLASRIGELNLSSPIIINAMTGGAHETTAVNEKLALIAKETGISMAVGSQMSAIKNKEFVSTYKITRKVFPNGIIIANLGKEATVSQAKEAIEMIEANALQIHLNVIQELVMPEGDRNFKGVLDNLQAIKEEIDVPLIVKEVGFGISKETAEKLLARGIKIIDIGGKGGTNFAEIENQRRKSALTFFNDWGIDTAASIIEVKTAKSIEVIASGGIQNSFQVTKALGLGASAIGIAGIVLKHLYNSEVKGTIDFINNMHYEIKLIMTALGASKVADLQHKPMVISGELKNWCDERGIDTTHIARRKLNK